MIRPVAALLIMALWAGNAAAAAPVPLPGGGTVTPVEVIWEPQENGTLWVRFRYLAPQIAREGGSLSFDAAMQDMAHLCRTVALPAVAADGRAAAVIVISLADRALEFGALDPEATQFFEAFRAEAGDCVVEPI